MIPRIILGELLNNTNTQNIHQVEIINLSRDVKDLKSEKYLKLNPQGIVPTLVIEYINNNNNNINDNNNEPTIIVIYETLAICYFLSELFINGKLEPNRNNLQKRAKFHQWMSLICNSLQNDSYHYYYSHRYVKSIEQEELLKKETEERMFEKFKIFENELKDGREYILGNNEYSIIDIYLFVVATWTRNMNLKARDLPFLGKYLERIFNRKIVNEIVKSERDSEPYY
ncbi:glutathione S-transferase [Naegleria gruberi]|uniref:Glutathione S-transferase n=1 Tax=Naegleria gruberi TaxID=5762 RepID=D2W6U8_NAEGR|nr:glutathione S-transferase [Naegleria gruberi]EFC35204.1 glutathione S-transferase [Naegleria gruberi]|eukprot:XP_002667948.1 glutathione S-transferase [Naegleria gruberi strain NEG-M]